MANIINTTLTKSPCASDCAILSIIYSAGVPGLILGITDTGFMTRDTKWFNMSQTICAVLDDDCSGLALVDVILINTRLIILTTLGLFISEDLRYPTGKMLKFSKPTLCGFEMDDYLRARIWYNRQCLANRENYEVDYVGLTFNKDKTLSQESTCFYSNDSFTKWHSCLPHRSKAEKTVSRRVVSFIVDYEQNTGIAILSQQNRAMVSVHILGNNELHKKKKFPAFWFPDADFIPFGMFFHPGSHFLYAYGNQVWLSYDGGNVFLPLIKLENETIVETDTCVYTQGIVFVTDKGTILYTKAGLLRYARLRVTRSNIFSMYFDHLGTLFHISLNDSSVDDLVVSKLDVNVLLKEDDLGFNAPLAAQYITEEQMIFCNHESMNRLVPNVKFSSLHVGKAFVYGPGGSGVINKVFRQSVAGNFLSCILVNVLDRFPVEFHTDSPALADTLTILDPPLPNNKYRLQLSGSAFQVFHMQLMRVIVGRPTLLDVHTEDSWDDSDSYIIRIKVQSKFFEQGKTSIAVIIRFASLLCDVTTIILTLKNSCSYLKTMHYVLPVKVSEEDWLSDSTGANALINLPINYRPPSKLGIAVPVTENFYNVDPSKDRMRNYFAVSKASGQYKQCANKTSRDECKCTTDMKVSFSVAFSDCKEKAIRMKFPVIKLPLFFTVADEGKSKNMTSPYFITIIEINNRTNWKVADTNVTSSTKKMKKFLESSLNTELYNPEGMTITITGSELFHFRVSTIPGVSFCNLFDEFQIYVDDRPLAFPGQYLISTITAVLIGGVIFFAFILQVYEIHIGTILQKLKRNKVASKTSVSTVSPASTELSDI